MPPATASPVREPLHGVRQIVRFNLPFYTIAAATVSIGPAVASMLPVNVYGAGVAYAGIGLAAFWVLASLGASWLIYDRSPLMSGTWIDQALGFRPRSWLNIHAGLDEFTPALRARFGQSYGRALDIFDPAEMTEPSIGRARRAAGSGDEESVGFRRLPAATGTVDAVLLLLSAHELRSHAARRVLFDEVHRVLAPEGRVVVAEHLRDTANFVAFGPGFLHFHSRRAWAGCFTQTGFVICSELSITPFVRVFVLASGRKGEAHRAFWRLP
jgi:SAM-dependent methyltransferase